MRTLSASSPIALDQIRPGLLIPNWPLPCNVRAAITTRRVPGQSSAPFESFNLGAHVGDAPEAVAANRAQLQTELGLAQPIVWLNQVHGTDVHEHRMVENSPVCADACISRTPGLACAVLTADCLAILLCTKSGNAVAAVHAGWRGLLAGVIEACVEQLAAGEQILAYVGPAISAAAFEVGPELRAAFLARDPSSNAAFKPGRGDRFFADLALLARQRLHNLGVAMISESGHCTYTEQELFYSHRRAGPRTGRFASMIWQAEP